MRGAILGVLMLWVWFAIVLVIPREWMFGITMMLLTLLAALLGSIWRR